mgnify:CR=1 FL=1
MARTKRTGLDKIDRRILNELQANNLISNTDLAGRVFTSEASCLRRVKRLRANGWIHRDTSIVDPNRAPNKMTIIINVTLAREGADIVDRFMRVMRETTEVRQCYKVAGETDFVIVVAVKDIEAYDVFADRMFQSNNNVLRFNSFIALRCYKFDTGIEFDIDDTDDC